MNLNKISLPTSQKTWQRVISREVHSESNNSAKDCMYHVFNVFFSKLVKFALGKQKFPNFIFEKITKNRWKIVVKLVEFMLAKQKFPKVSQFYC
jgi:hypothetical protein